VKQKTNKAREKEGRDEVRPRGNQASVHLEKKGTKSTRHRGKKRDVEKKKKKKDANSL